MEKLNFETKCRRCSGINIFFGSEKPITVSEFQSMVAIYLREPPLFPCPKCGIFTIQEIVSYSRPESTKEDFELTQSQKDLIEKCETKP